jgi:hypothetical protein
MPTATKFAWIFESTAINIGGYTRWTTLGGYNAASSGGATQAQIDTSQINAAKLYFNFYQINLTLNGSSSSVNVDGESLYQPQSRIDLGGSSWLYITGSTVIDMYSIYRFYDGAISSESNFVGYGVLPGSSSSSQLFSTGVRSQNDYTGSYVKLYGVTNRTDYSHSTVERKLGYTQINGMHFVCECEANAQGDGLGSYTVSPSTASASATHVTQNDPSDASIDSFTFFTY